MKLSELEDGTAVDMELYIEGKRYVFPSVIEFQKRGKVYFQPIRIGEKLLNVTNDKVQMHVFFSVEDNKPIVWKDVEVREEVYKKKVYYTIDGDTQGGAYNRRRAFRQYVGEPALAQLGNGIGGIRVIVKDISYNGFSFVCDEDLENAEATMVLIPFLYQDDEVSFNLTLSGKIVRKQPVEGRKNVYGCVLVNKNELISKFINYKQKKDLARLNQ